MEHFTTFHKQCAVMTMITSCGRPILIGVLLFFFSFTKLASAQIVKENPEYIKLSAICQETKLIFNLMDEIERNSSLLYKYFKDGKKAIVYNDIKVRGTYLEEYVDDLKKHGKRVHRVEVFVTPVPIEKKYTVYVKPAFYKNDKKEEGFNNECIVLEVAVNIENVDKRITIFSYKREKIESKKIGSCIECDDDKINSLITQEVEKKMMFFLPDAHSHGQLKKSVENRFQEGYVESLVSFGKEAYSLKKKAKSYLITILDRNGKFQLYKTGAPLDKDGFIQELDVSKYAYSVSNIEVNVLDVNKKKALLPTKKVDTRIDIKYTASFNGKLYRREALATLISKPGSKSPEKSFRITKLSTVKDVEIIDKNKAKGHVEAFLKQYRADIGSLVGVDNKAGALATQYFSKNAGVNNDISYTGKSVVTSPTEYLSSIASLHASSVLSYADFSIGPIHQSERNENLYFSTSLARINHKVYTDSSFFLITGEMTFVVQFYRLPNGGFSEPKIERTFMSSPPKVVENLIPQSPKPTETNEKIVYTEIERARIAFLSTGLEKVNNFLELLSISQAGNLLDSYQKNKLTSLFYLNGKYSKIGVSSYRNLNNFRYFTVSDYLKHIESYPYEKHSFNPVLISDITKVSINEIKGKPYSWIAKVQFEQLFDGKHKIDSRSYCDFTIKEISLVFVKEGGAITPYLLEVIPIKNETTKRECDKGAFKRP